MGLDNTVLKNENHTKDLIAISYDYLKPVKDFFSKEICKFSRPVELSLASGAYLLGSYTDFYATALGLKHDQIEEKNFLLQSYINEFGENGILLPKALLAMTLIACCVYLNDKYEKGETKVKPEYILYPGGVATALTGFSWMIDKYVF